MRKVIFIDTITREFIKFAKIMGILPLIYGKYFKHCSYSFVSGYQELFRKNSFYNYARNRARLTYYFLNDNLIKNVYFFKGDYTKNTDIDILVELFLSHLKDKGYMRYIKIIY